MSEAQAVVSHRKEYLIVFGILAALTAIEVGVATIQIDKSLIIAILIVLAVVKAACVAAFYMHLKGEGGGLIFIAAIPFVAAGGFALALIGLFSR